MKPLNEGALVEFFNLTVKTCHDKAVTTTCSIATVKNTRQSTSSGLMKKATKCQRRRQKLRVPTEMMMSMMVMGMAVTAVRH
eukprot:5370818-Ditylum_brightwellii.AAC.1